MSKWVNSVVVPIVFLICLLNRDFHIRRRPLSFSLPYPCKIWGPRDVAFKSYTPKWSELLEKCGYPPFLNFHYIFTCNFKIHLSYNFIGFMRKIGSFIWCQHLHSDGWIQKWSGHTPLAQNFTVVGEILFFSFLNPQPTTRGRAISGVLPHIHKTDGHFINYPMRHSVRVVKDMQFIFYYFYLFCKCSVTVILMDLET